MSTRSSVTRRRQAARAVGCLCRSCGFWPCHCDERRCFGCGYPGFVPDHWKTVIWPGLSAPSSAASAIHPAIFFTSSARFWRRAGYYNGKDRGALSSVGSCFDTAGSCSSKQLAWSKLVCVPSRCIQNSKSFCKSFEACCGFCCGCPSFWRDTFNVGYGASVKPIGQAVHLQPLAASSSPPTATHLVNKSTPSAFENSQSESLSPLLAESCLLICIRLADRVSSSFGQPLVEEVLMVEHGSRWFKQAWEEW